MRTIADELIVVRLSTGKADGILTGEAALLGRLIPVAENALADGLAFHLSLE